MLDLYFKQIPREDREDINKGVKEPTTKMVGYECVIHRQIRNGNLYDNGTQLANVRTVKATGMTPMVPFDVFYNGIGERKITTPRKAVCT